MGSEGTVINPGPSQPMSLMIIGAVLAAVAGLVLAVSQGNGFAALVASVGLAFASTFWIIGMIAMGVRVGMGSK
jgi:hypothetical protein